MTALDRTPPGRTFRRAAIALAAACSALVVAEVAARLWLQRAATPESFRRYASIADLRARGEQGIFERHAYLGYVPRPGYASRENRHDSRGYRSREFALPKPAGEYRIACLGGSTTYTQNVDDWRASYPVRLEDELVARGFAAVRVINAGVPNWTSYEHLIDYQLRTRDLDCDLVVVLEGANDLKARLVPDPALYRGDNSGFRAFSTNLSMPPLREHFALWRIAAVNAGWMRSHADLERALDNHSGTSVWGALRFQMIDGTYPTGEMLADPADAILARNPPVYFERNLEDLAVLARRDGTDVLFLTTPSCAARVAKSERAARIFEDGLAEMDAALRRIAERTGASVHELAAAMPRDPKLYLDEMHQTAEGAHLLAKSVAGAVERTFLARSATAGR